MSVLERSRYGIAPGLEDVTVVIPHLRGNRQDWLERAISSLPNGVAYLVVENDRGELAAALNAAVEAVETEWVYRLDDDDALVDGSLSELLGVAFDADVVYPTMIFINEGFDAVKGTHPAWPFCGNRLEQLNFISGCSLVRRSALLAVGGYQAMEVFEDWDLWVRMHRAGFRFKPCPDAKLLYRQRDGSRNKRIASKQMLLDWRERWVGERATPIAQFYHQGSAPGTYLRCQLPARHLPGIATNDWWIRHDKRDGTIVESDIEAGHVVLQWPGDKGRAQALVMFRNQGIKVWVEVDDNYLTWDKLYMDRVGWGVDIGDAPHTTAGHRWITKFADGVIVTTEHLAEIYRQVNPNVVVAPNCVDEDDWEVFAEARKPDDGIWHVGWFASVSHQGDEKLIVRAAGWAAQQKDVAVAAMGYDPQWTFAHTRLPWANDLSMYRLMLHSLDIGWCPVTPTSQGLGRSDIKASELAMAGALPIVSDLAPYKDWVHGETCLKARNGREFLKHTQWALKNRDEAREIARNAKEWVLSNRNIRKQISIWREAFS